jgi:galactose mutarotase-like enzyme
VDDARHVIQGEGLTATVKADGAELVSLKDARGAELLWQADPAWWPRHAPILFPLVGRLEDDALRHRGGVHRIGQHGFARDRTFAWVERAPDSCTLRLSDDEATRIMFPFAFDLRVTCAMVGDRLDVTYAVSNPGTEELPLGIGAHPGIAWPLAPGIAREDHVLVFSDPEPAPVRRVAGALLDPAPQPSPIEGDRLRLHDALFVNDAIILDPLASRSVTLAAPGAPSVEVGWEGFPHLGIWSKPGAPFLCIEPWQSYVAPKGLAREFAAKPGLAILPPGGRRTWRHWFRVHPA